MTHASPTVQVAADAEQMSRQAADLILRQVTHKPDLLLCASSGQTPTRTYDLLAAAHAQQPDLFRQLRVIKIDEWAGLAPDHPASCEHYLQEKLIAPLGIDPSRYVAFQGDAPDPQAECDRVSTWLDAHGPIDLCILGLGANGHLALNEPAESLPPRAYVVPLSKRSLQHSMLATTEHKPTHGLTLGLAQILHSRQILLLVNGSHKKRVLQQLLQPHLSTHFPASLLWLHPNLTLLCDRASAPE